MISPSLLRLSLCQGSTARYIYTEHHAGIWHPTDIKGTTMTAASAPVLIAASGGVIEQTAGSQKPIMHSRFTARSFTQAGTMTMRKYSKAGLLGATQVTVPSIQ